MAKGGKRAGAGRKAGSPNKVSNEVRLNLQELTVPHVPAAVQTLVQNLSNPDGKIQVAAAKEILDRACGKAKQSVDLNATLSLADLVMQAVQGGDEDE